MHAAYFHFPRVDSFSRRQSSPLDLLLSASASERIGDWRTHAQQCLLPPAATCVRTAAGMACAAGLTFRSPPHSPVCVATPVHLEPTLRGVLLPADGILQFEPSEALAWAAALEKELPHQDVEWRANGDMLFSAGLHAGVTEAEDPQALLGQEIDAVPLAGESSLPSARAGRLLLSEIEMWMFEHALNAKRRERGEKELTTLWLWGAGPAISRFPSQHAFIIGADPLFSAWWKPVGGLHTEGTLVVASLPGTAGYETTEHLLAQSIRLLRQRELEAVYLCFGFDCRTVRHVARRRWFSRAPPWWSSLEVVDE